MSAIRYMIIQEEYIVFYYWAHIKLLKVLYLIDWLFSNRIGTEICMGSFLLVSYLNPLNTVYQLTSMVVTPLSHVAHIMPGKLPVFIAYSY